MTASFLATKAGKWKVACVIFAGIVAGMSYYSHKESLYYRYYEECLSDQLRQKLDTDRIEPLRQCPHPILEQVLVGVSIISVIITTTSVVIFSRLKDTAVPRELIKTDSRYNQLCIVFLVLGGAMYLASAGLLTTQCSRDYTNYEDEEWNDKFSNVTSLYKKYCNYELKTPEKYAAGAMAIFTAIIFWLSGTKLEGGNNGIVQQA